MTGASTIMLCGGEVMNITHAYQKVGVQRKGPLCSIVMFTVVMHNILVQASLVPRSRKAERRVHCSHIQCAKRFCVKVEGNWHWAINMLADVTLASFPGHSSWGELPQRDAWLILLFVHVHEGVREYFPHVKYMYEPLRTCLHALSFSVA